MKNFRKLTALLLVFALVFVALPLNYAKADDVVFTILHSNDVHGNAVGDDADDERAEKIGFARYKTYIEQVRKENPVIVFDAGDLLHGTTLATIDKGRTMGVLANMLDVKAFVPGNHDFNYGYNQLVELRKNSNFPFLAANITKDGELLFEDTEVLELKESGLKIGVFGLATPETKTKSNPLNTEGLEFTDSIEAAKNSVAKLKEQGVDLIIALSHLGMDEASEPNSKDIANAVPDIDLIIDGHSHHKLENGEVVNGVLIVQTHEHLKNIGRVDVSGSKGNLELSASLVPFADVKDLEPNAEIEAAIERANEDNKEILEQVVGKTMTDLIGERAVVRTGESNLGQLLTDAMLEETGADVAITNGGGIRASIEAGEITREEVLTAFPFTNYPVLLEATGQNIKDALEYGLDAFPEQAGKFPHVAGMTFDVDLNGEAPEVLNLKINGEDVDLAKEYKLVTNDFMAIGGDGYEMFKGLKKLSEHGLLSEVLEDYIGKLTEENPEGFEYELETRINFLEILTLPRISGADRFATAIEVSKEAFEEADTVIIASGMKFPDSLAAGPLTAVKNAPILLSAEKAISDETLAEIERLGATKAIIVGGVNTVGEEVVEALEAKELEVTRLGGADRYATAELIAKEVKQDDNDKVIIASGENSADALAISSLATKEKLPILLTPKAALVESTAKLIEEWEVKEAVIVGGVNTITEELAKSVADMEVETTRLAGEDRFGTAVAIAKAVYPEATKFVVADGMGFADALTVAPLLESEAAPLLLVTPNAIPAETLAHVEGADYTDAVVVGGPNSVSEVVARTLYKLVK